MESPFVTERDTAMDAVDSTRRPWARRGGRPLCNAATSREMVNDENEVFT